jgi:molybdenum cofactor biosynthesis protein B
LKPHEEHRKGAERHLRVVIVSVSTSRYGKRKEGKPFTDEAGDVATEEARRAGHSVTRRVMISDDRIMIRKEARTFLSGEDDVLLFAGGTGLSPRDITVDTIRPFFEKELEGFGELVRRLGYDEVGAAAALTRATAGVAKGKLIACMPGSPDGVRTAMRAFAKEFPHMVYVARKRESGNQL